MDIRIASLNKPKNKGVERGFSKLSYFQGASYFPFDSESGVRDQPWGTGEIYTGAANRAITTFNSGKCDLAVGVESGVDLIDASLNKSGLGMFLNRTVCVIYDGEMLYPGESRAFGLTHGVFDRMVGRGLTLHEVLVLEGIVDHKSETGLISVLTDGEIDRSQLVEEAAYTAGLLLQKKHLGYVFFP